MPSPPARAWRTCSGTVSFALMEQPKPDRNKYAYFMHGQNHAGGVGKLPTPPATETHHPDPPHNGRGNPGRNVGSSSHRCSRPGVRRICGRYGDVRCSRPRNQFRGMPICNRNSKREQQAVPTRMHGRAAWRAFLRANGQRTLYRDPALCESVSHMTLGEVRARLGIPPGGLQD